MIVDNMYHRSLIEILSQIRTLLIVSDDGFSRSTWKNNVDTVAEIDQYLSVLYAGNIPAMTRMRILFLPTGSLQEISINSGWGQKFLELALQFDILENTWNKETK